MQKATRSLPVGLSEETRPQTQPFLMPYLANGLDSKCFGYCVITGTECSGGEGEKTWQEKSWSVGVPSSSCTMKGQLFHSPSFYWPSALFLSAVRHSPFPAANNTSLHVLVSRDRVGSTLHYCCLSVAVTPISSQSVHMLPSPAPLLHWLKKKVRDCLQNSGILCWRLPVFWKKPQVGVPSLDSDIFQYECSCCFIPYEFWLIKK